MTNNIVNGQAKFNGGNEAMFDTEYVFGNAVAKRALTEVEAPKRSLNPQTVKNREKAHHMSLGYVLFLSLCLFVTGYMLVNYINLTSTLTNDIKKVASLQSELNNTRLENDEKLNIIESSINLETIKEVAINELGMTYAKEGQIQYYEKNTTDYMRKADSYQGGH